MAHVVPYHLHGFVLARDGQSDTDWRYLVRTDPAVVALDLVPPIATRDKLWTMYESGSTACHNYTNCFR